MGSLARQALRLIVTSALYGFCIGSVHSLTFALRNLLKFPLLILGTAAVCSLACYLTSRAITRALDFRAVLGAVLGLFAQTSTLLASLGPVMLFLAQTIQDPDETGLGDYPLFLATHVIFVASCGSLALIRCTRGLSHRFALPAGRARLLMASWMALCLLVGSQFSWYLRPFCGVRTVQAPFFLGAEPDFRGATSFFEAIGDLVDPPPGRIEAAR
ncbi:MAG: hypothetical protein OEY14_09635 [Myxococcales bacterium]|nr:hypothetical protein [Myxococcales bacterium]